MSTTPPMKIENGVLVVQKNDGCTCIHLTHEGLLEMLQERFELKQKFEDQEYEINRRQPDRFLPDVIRKLDDNFTTAQKAGDTARSEAYAASAAMIRGFLRESDEREGKR